MRMLLIDPDRHSVEAVDVNPNDFAQQKQMLNADTFDGCTFAIGRQRYYCRVDDTGLIDGKTQWSMPNLYGGPLAGKALVMALEGPEGDAGECGLDAGGFADELVWQDAAA